MTRFAVILTLSFTLINVSASPAHAQNPELTSSGAMGKEEVAAAWLSQAYDAYRWKKYDRAERYWRFVTKDFPGTKAWAQATYMLGTMYKDKRQYSKALEHYQSVLSAEATAHESKETIAYYKSDAQWRIAGCYFEQGLYRESLNACKVMEAHYPYRSWCGNAIAQRQYKSALRQGICYEWLNEPAAAIRMYFRAINDGGQFYTDPAAHLRIYNMYTAADALDKLDALLDEMDEEEIDAWRKKYQNRQPPSVEKILQYSPSSNIRQCVRIADMGRKKNWDGLIVLLHLERPGGGPMKADQRLNHWEACEAARILAKYPKRAVPRLVEAIQESDRMHLPWLYYALGRCGNRKAVDALASEVSIKDTREVTDAILYALSLAGALGEKAIASLEQEAEGVLAQSIQSYRAGALIELDEDPGFPMLKKSVTLPASFSALQE